MILINLLPHREEARKRRREAFYVILGLAGLLGLLICGAIYLWYDAQISAQQTKNHYLESANTRLDGQIKDVAALKAEIEALRARQKAVEDLQSDRNLPVYLLEELVKQMPDGIYLTSLKQENQSLSLTGVAQSNERVSELLRNLANNSQWLTHPELIEIVASSVALAKTDQRRVYNFTIRTALQRSSDVQKAAAAASAALAKGAAPVVQPASAASAQKS